MLEDKRKDLMSEKQKALLERLVAELSRTRGDLYYQSTSEVAFQLEQHIKNSPDLLTAEKELVGDLSRRDIEIILSHGK